MQSVFGGLPQPGIFPSPRKGSALSDGQIPYDIIYSEACRRLSYRGTSTQRGLASRVTKPNSTSNSPRATGRGRRGTTISVPTPSGEIQRSFEKYETVPSYNFGQNSRPLSWHPSSFSNAHQFGQQPHQQYTGHLLLTPDLYRDRSDAYFMQPHFSPMISAHSNEISPCSAFSSLAPGFQPPTHTPYSVTNGMGSQYVNESQPSVKLSERYNAGAPLNAHSVNDSWNNHLERPYSATTPPTPENILRIPQHHHLTSSRNVSPSFPAALDEAEDQGGEVLVGMGLYDAPDKVEDDPHLNRYRSTVNSLLGSALRTPESTGKGLMLEQTWEPPALDDEADAATEEEQDEEEEEEEEEDE